MMRANLFHKMVTILISLILVTLMFYGISYRKDVRVITNQIKTTDLNHLEFLTAQIDNNINQLTGNMYALQRDPTIRDYEQIERLGHLIDAGQTTLTVLEKLSIQTSSSTWENQIVLYNLLKGETLSSDSSLSFDTELLHNPLPTGWVFAPNSRDDNKKAVFRLMLSDPANFRENPTQANMITEIYFPASNIEKMFKAFQSQNSGDTFLYHPSFGLLNSENSDEQLAQNIVKHMLDLTSTQESSNVIKLEGGSYLVSAVQSSTLGWHVIHYSPMEQILQPLQSSRYSFIMASCVLLAMSLFVSLSLYRQVQLPISLLLRSLNRMKKGQWSTRIHVKTNNEFSLLNEEFNEMASTLQSLIEQVYLEQLRAKDAYLKQLQSQINPHFLYNSLFFIKSKASIGDTESVEAMALNLAEYYRYITKLDHTLTTIKDEIKLLENYLAIQNLRKQRLHYEIDMPEDLLEERIPRLLIQPLVENSIIHGIEKKMGLGFILIRGIRSGDTFMLSVEDNGAGMDNEQIAELYDKINESTREDGGCGLWNVQQRLKLQFGEASKILITASEQGGLKATLYIQKKEHSHVSNINS